MYRAAGQSDTSVTLLNSWYRMAGQVSTSAAAWSVVRDRSLTVNPVPGHPHEQLSLWAQGLENLATHACRIPVGRAPALKGNMRGRLLHCWGCHALLRKCILPPIADARNDLVSAMLC